MGWKVNIGEGRELVATRVPNRKKPYLGIQHGSTFLALAQFLSDEDMEFLFQAMQGVVVIPTRAEATDDHP